MKNNFLFCNNNTNFFRNHSLKIFILIFFFIFLNGFSQVSNYSFSKYSGTYTPLVLPNSVIVSPWNDNNPILVNIPFTFYFNGVGYSSCWVNPNGFITFGATSSGSEYNPISSNTNYAGAISAFGRNLSSSINAIQSGEVGTLSDRAYVIQWKSVTRIINNSIVSGDNLNFQIKLYENSNKIEITYGVNSTTNTTNNFKGEVGLRGNNNLDFNNRQGGNNTNWNNLANGTASADKVNFKNLLVPADGLIFSWIPYCSPITSTNPNTLFITEVTFSGINNVNNTSNASNGFQDFTNLSSKCEQNVGNSISVATKSNENSRIKAWIDWNRDGDFNDAGEQIYDSGSTAGIHHNFNINIPENAENGDYRIRMRNAYFQDRSLSFSLWPFGFYWSDWATNYNLDFNVCENFNLTSTSFDYEKRKFGEAEDYIFNVINCKKTWNGGTGDWNNPSSWIPVGVPTANSCIVIPNGVLALTTEGKGKNLNISAGTLTVNSGASLTIKDAITVNNSASVILEDSANLVQEGSTNTNSGNIIVKRTAKPMKRFDYTYWSSPVANQSLHAFSPTTFFDKFHSWNPGSGTQAGYWQVHPSNGASVPMVAGKGYIVRAPQSFPVATVNSENFVGNFNGVPNSGDIQIAIAGNSSASVQKWNLIGNPYPSALNIDYFFNDSFNTSNIYGTIYLWTHNTPISANNSGTSDLNYAASDYASYNGVGGTATSAATQNPLNPVINPSPNNAVPNGFIASGQSFFIRGKSNTNVRFTNAMRVRNNNNQFFRIGNVENQSTSVEKNRFWLNLRNTQGAFHQTLVGYVSGATNDLDDNFDGELFGGNFVSIYSVLADKKMTIQGKAVPFENTDTVQLGITTTIAGNFSISLDNFDGLFESQDILLKDNLLNLVHNLKTGGYEFTSGIGTFNERFEIVYQSETLGNNTPDFNTNSIVIYKNDKTIIVNSGISTISNVQVFDIQGRLLYDGKNVNNSETIIRNLPPTEQMLIVRVQTLEGNLVSKKII